MKNNHGYQIVLTANRTLMSEFWGSVFLGFSACVPSGLILDWLYFSLLCPLCDVKDDGSAAVAPCGTRRVEAILLRDGFDKEDVIVAHPDRLKKVVGQRTKALGITETDPLGMGPATSTFTQIFGGEAYMAIKFRELLQHPLIRRFKPKVIVGGPGAWQLQEEETRRKFGIDCVVIGEGERVVSSLFEKALNSQELPGVIFGESASDHEIPVIQGATLNGIVEIARGCGRGCDFCTPTLQYNRSIPIRQILEEVRINLEAGRQPLLHAEDVLRYGAKGIKVNKEAVLGLFKSVKGCSGVRDVGISHFALSSAAAAPDTIGEISDILGLTEDRWLGGQTGIETGSPRLISKHMKGKCKPFVPEGWPDVVQDAFEVLSENNWLPCATLILGLPQETEKDLEMTVSLVEKLASFRSLIVPLFLVAMGALGSKCDSFTMDQLTPKHCELLLECWKHNLKWIPFLFDRWSETSIGNKMARRGLGMLLSYGVKHTKELIQVCERDYNYDLKAMVKDFESRRETMLKLLPVRLMNPLRWTRSLAPSVDAR